MNEKLYAEQLLKTKTLDIPVAQFTYYVSKYYQQFLNYSDAYTYNTVLKNLKERQVTPTRSHKNYITHCITKTKDVKLTALEYIPITTNEIAMIEQLEDSRLEQLAFSCLVVAKYFDYKNPDNNHWVNVCSRSLTNIFKLANLTGSKEVKCNLVRSLYQTGLITGSMKVNNTNLCVQFIDNSQDIQYKVTSFDDLGRQYMVLEKRYFYCAKCGRYSRQSNTRPRKYCRQCAPEQKPLLNKRMQRRHFV